MSKKESVKEESYIPTSKVERATRMFKSGAKVSSNYLKYYAKKAFDKNTSREDLDQKNATEIYGALSQLKGSALKAAQMISMDKNVLPAAYTDAFAQAHYQAPALSGPLIVKTFRSEMGKSPTEIFDKFEMKATHAASMGQVHKAYIGDKVYAVKIQYPGVADSIRSDLKMLRPIAARIMQMKSSELDKYFEEVAQKLQEEADYEAELKNAQYLTNACKSLDNLVFPHYYPELSGKRILCMDWIEGQHLKEFTQKEQNPEKRNFVGQSIWDFYNMQVHQLQFIHADPHPGNFLVTPEGKLGILDFGCIKEIPQDFYSDFFSLTREEIVSDPKALEKAFMNLEILHPKDNSEVRTFFSNLFKDMIGLLVIPLKSKNFDFGDDDYFKEIYQYGQKTAQMKEVKKYGSARGSRHFIYINRTYFGLYSLLNLLQANIETDMYRFKSEATVK